MAEADDATTELIAKILASDNDQYGYDDLGTGDVSDDSDYGEPKRKKQRKGRATTKVQPLSKPTHAEKPRRAPQGTEEEEYTASGRRKRKDTGARREGAAKGWTEEEERLFLEGLELYGREWHKAAAHVGTRDKKAFTSHAQKHFIKLCIADKPLPQKVVETGTGTGLGYTLSGLLLDPNSASARSYGFKPEHLERLVASGGPGSQGLLLAGKENHHTNKEAAGGDSAAKPDAPAIEPIETPHEDAAHQTTEVPGTEVPEVEAPSEPRQNHQPAQPPKKRRTEMPKSALGEPEAAKSPQEPTEYRKNRPRREGAGMRSRWGDTTESLDLVSCSEFIGPPGSGASLAQPFAVTVDGKANLVMDFHAHLCGCEIIGLLGGRWDAEHRHISIKEAFPCRRLEGSHSGTSVEVDPNAQLAALEKMEQLGLTSVGWYHSHPIFAPTPSQKDNENQRNQQVMHRCGKTSLEPCVGAIVGPYDATNASEASVITWFVVQSRSGKLVPFNVRLSAPSEPPQLPDQHLESALKDLVTATAIDPDRLDFTKEWRPFRLLVDGQPQGGRLSNLSKMRLAIARHLRGEGVNLEAAAAFLDSIFGHLKQQWQIPLRPEPLQAPNIDNPDASEKAVDYQPTCEIKGCSAAAEAARLGKGAEHLQEQENS